MEIEKLIEKAIQGGWEGTDEYGGEYEMKDYLYSIEKIVLDPKFWQAVGKVIQSELGEPYSVTFNKCEHIFYKDWAKEKALKMIDHLFEGGSIKSYIKSL